MLAFHSDPALKAFVLGELERHRAADTLTKDIYWEHGKGCAVGCTLEAVRKVKGKGAKVRRAVEHRDHGAYETHLGIPRILARLEDHMFESLDNGHSFEWPLRFTQAIRPGADLAMVWPKFALWLLTEFLPPVTKNQRVKASLAEVGELYREWCTGTKPSLERWHNAANAAYAAAAAADAATAYAAAYAAANAANAAYAAAAAADAAAAYAAAYAAANAAYAAAAAADAAAAYAAAYAAAARKQAWIIMSDKLIELLQQA